MRAASSPSRSACPFRMSPSRCSAKPRIVISGALRSCDTVWVNRSSSAFLASRSRMSDSRISSARLRSETSRRATTRRTCPRYGNERALSSTGIRVPSRRTHRDLVRLLVLREKVPVHHLPVLGRDHVEAVPAHQLVPGVAAQLAQGVVDVDDPAAVVDEDRLERRLREAPEALLALPQLLLCLPAVGDVEEEAEEAVGADGDGVDQAVPHRAVLAADPDLVCAGPEGQEPGEPVPQSPPRPPSTSRSAIDRAGASSSRQ